MQMDLVKVTTENDWDDYHSLRTQVLWDAQGRSGYNRNHEDEYHSSNHPLLLKADGKPVGTIRLDDFGNHTGAIRLVAIAIGMQGKGMGKLLMHLAEDYARKIGLGRLFVNAAPRAVDFYKKLGWEYNARNQSELKGIAAECVQMSKMH